MDERKEEPEEVEGELDSSRWGVIGFNETPPEGPKPDAEKLLEEVETIVRRKPKYTKCPDCGADLIHDCGTVNCVICGYAKALSREELEIPKKGAEDERRGNGIS